jgi:hypothetical protein
LRIAFGSDERTHLAYFVEQELRSRGHQVELVGPPTGGPLQWTDVTQAVAERLSSTEAVAGEILDAWFSTSPDQSEAENVEKLKQWDRRYRARDVAAPAQGEKGRV